MFTRPLDGTENLPKGGKAARRYGPQLFGKPLPFEF
jgi:hypothetical protein